jgi:hypothetical protein
VKVVCTNLGENLGYETCIDHITVGKSYDVILQHDDYIIKSSTITDYVTLYDIRNDEGNIIRYNKKLFLTIDDWRELKLKELGL